MSRMPSPLWTISIALLMVAIVFSMFQGGDFDNNNSNFYNPLSIFSHSPLRSNDAQEAREFCAKPSEMIGEACCDFGTVERLNVEFSAKLHELVNMPFFRYFKANLYKDCPFWQGAGLCMNRDCSVETIDEKEIPEQWRTQSLSKVSMSPNQLFKGYSPPPQIKDQNFCVMDTDADSDTEGVYVDLQENPERFTGYTGPSAGMVWKAIYEENCFDVSREMTAGCQQCSSDRKYQWQQQQQKEYEKQSSLRNRGGKKNTDGFYSPPETGPLVHIKPTEAQLKEIFSRIPKDKGQLQSLLQDMTQETDPESTCLEKRVYYRLVSGLHSSISIHICDEWFDQKTGVWGPNLDCFISRVGLHPERLENIYFDYVILLRAVAKISDYLVGYEFCTGDPKVDGNVKNSILELVDLVKKCPPTFDEKLLFQGQDTVSKQIKIQFRDHFRNVTRIMDCVGCEKCRLWGKVQTTGLGTALKILFSYDDQQVLSAHTEDLLERTEIVALVNTFNRFSESISAIERFERMYSARLGGENAQSTEEAKPLLLLMGGSKNLWKNLRSLASNAGRALEMQLEQRNITLPASVKRVIQGE